VGINYEYSVPQRSAVAEEPDSYSWSFTQFEPCTAACGGGQQTRTVTCNSRNTLEEVDKSLCDSSARPAETQKCGQIACPPKWIEGTWSKCSEPCGKNGTQERLVHCERISGDGLVVL
jgi:hypothetical protein